MKGTISESIVRIVELGITSDALMRDLQADVMGTDVFSFVLHGTICGGKTVNPTRHGKKKREDEREDEIEEGSYLSPFRVRSTLT
jgi:hypothetical protein